MKHLVKALALSQALLGATTALAANTSIVEKAIRDTFEHRSSHPFTGGMNGGGGRSIVCRNPDGSIKSAELLDLFEARTLFKLQLRDTRATLAEDMIQAFSAIEKHVSYSVSSDPETVNRDIALFNENTTFISYPNKLTNVDDSEEPVTPTGCAVEQAAFFYEEDRLLIQKEIFDAMDTLNQSALYAHEAAYFMARAYLGDLNSKSARKFVGYMFSTTLPTPINAEYYPLLQEKGNIHCFSEETPSNMPLSIVLKKKSNGDTQIAYSDFLSHFNFFKTNTKELKGSDYYDTLMKLFSLDSSTPNPENDNFAFYELTETTFEHLAGFNNPTYIVLSSERNRDPNAPENFRIELKAMVSKLDGTRMTTKIECGPTL